MPKRRGNQRHMTELPCARCHEVKPKTTEHFSESPVGSGRFLVWCKPCTRTYQRNLVTSRKSLRPRSSIVDRFWARVDKSGPTVSAALGPCWAWTGNTLGVGYGAIWSAEHGRAVGAHRLSWEIANGRPPGAMYVLHACDNILCVNPEHLSLGTQLDNVRDMDTKGRRRTVAPCGERQHLAKLTGPDVLAMRLASRLVRREHVAAAFGVSVSTVKNVVSRHTWKHI